MPGKSSMHGCIEAWQDAALETDDRLTKSQGRPDSAGPQLAPPGGPRMAKETDETMRKRKSFREKDAAQQLPFSTVV